MIKEAGRNIKLMTSLTFFQIIIPLRFTKTKTTRPKMLPKELVIKEYLMLRENQNQLIHILGKRDNEERDRDSNTILLL